MHVIHTAHDEHGDILEVSESIWPADRIILIDDYPIEQAPEQPTAASEV
jgi:GntR family transcriptional regulator